ncbi:MAG: hypothetical protein ACP5D4_00180 [Baaleninema sp.]
MSEASGSPTTPYKPRFSVVSDMMRSLVERCIYSILPCQKAIADS